jgi:hypothetical protein
MARAAGFGRANLRLVVPAPDYGVDDQIIVDAAEDDADQPQVNTSGEVFSIEHGDGSVTISMNDKPLLPGIGHNRGPQDWFANLAEDMDEGQLATIADDLMRGIADDEQSRREWVDTVATFIKLIGVTIEVPAVSGAADGAPVEGMSRVRHPLLLEAVLRFQANARGEFLPADGPMKIRNDSSDGVETELLAGALEKDMNHYLTAHATEYYPDSDRMYFRLGLEGTAFKKVYRCPLRMRPVSETVIANDLIVSNDATDLANARRVTHRLMMSPTTIRRMQIIGAYLDVDLGTPVEPNLDAAQREERRQQGQADASLDPDDRDRQLYECYCDLDLVGYEHMWKGRPSGLEIPYRVTVDVTSRKVLSLVRDYDEPDDDAENNLPKRRDTFVQFSYVPGFGFYALGLGHILGNTTNAITAAWREMLDNGMFANFPGFLIAKAATRQQTSIIRVPPGGGQPVDTLGKPINQSVMPLPYNTTQMPPLMQLIESMATTGSRIGGTAEIQVGEGRQDAPVGTTLALIDQATKIENSVHKRLHTAQAQEFKLIVRCFREHPEDFLRCEFPSKQDWDQQTFLQALSTCDLVPQADPNTSSQLQRMMRAMGIKQLQSQGQSLYDPIAVDTYALKSMGVNNPSQFFVPPSAMGQPPPQLQQMQADMAAKKQQADARMLDAQSRKAIADAKTAEVKAKEAQGGFAKAGGSSGAQPTGFEALDAHTKLMDAETRQFTAHAKLGEMQMQSEEKAADRQQDAQTDHLDLIKTLLAHHAEGQQLAMKHAHEQHEGAHDREADAREGSRDRGSQVTMAKIAAKAAQAKAAKAKKDSPKKKD